MRANLEEVVYRMPTISQRTGVSDPTYDLISVLYHCLQAIETCEQYLRDMKGDKDAKAFIERFIELNRLCADEGKSLLIDALQREEQEVTVRGKR